jgi:hypothetical protein
MLTSSDKTGAATTTTITTGEALPEENVANKFAQDVEGVKLSMKTDGCRMVEATKDLEPGIEYTVFLIILFLLFYLFFQHYQTVYLERLDIVLCPRSVASSCCSRSGIILTFSRRYLR